jgi:hypothetical protein
LNQTENKTLVKHLETMKKTFAFLFMLILIATFQSYAQSGSYNIDPSTKRVTNLNTRYEFSNVYTYDFDLKKGTQSYRANCLVIIEINGNGTGRLITALDGEKNILTLVSCYKYDSHYEFEATNQYGKNLNAQLIIENGYIEKFWIRGDNNVGVVFD